MKLVDDWKDAWKWFSTWGAAAATSFLATWAVIPEKFQDVLPQKALIGIAIVLIALGTAGRMVQQGPKDASK